MKTIKIRAIIYLILAIGTFQARAALISIEGVIEGDSRQPMGIRGETMDYLKFEVMNTSDVRITGTDLSWERLLILAGYTGRDDKFEFLGNPFEFEDNYPDPELPFIERQLDAGTYVIVVDSTEDSGYDIWDGFVPVNRGGGGFSIAPYSFEVSGDVRPLEFWEGKFDPTPYGSFDVTIIPEPSSVLLLTFGAGGILFYRRAKRRQREQHINRRTFH